MTGIIREKLGKNNNIYPVNKPVAQCFHDLEPLIQERKIQTTWDTFKPQVYRNETDKSGQPLITFFERNVNKTTVDSIIKQWDVNET